MHQEHSKTTQHSINHNRSIIKRILWLLSLDWNSTNTVVASEFTIHTTLALKVFSPLESSRVESIRVHDIAFKIKSNKIPAFALHKNPNQTKPTLTNTNHNASLFSIPHKRRQERWDDDG